MEVLHGISVHPGVAIAAAARLQEEYGVFSLSPQRLRRLGERLRRFGVEAPEIEQVILIADRVPPGFAQTPIPGLEFVGIAMQSESALMPPPRCPTVMGLGETLLTQVEEEDVVIIDGDRGRVYLAPDAATLARYQAPFTLARRFFLEGAHLPAKTASDGRTITVLTLTPTRAAIDEAMDAGADGILIPTRSALFGPGAPPQTAGEQTAMLLEIARMVAGKPLFLNVPSHDLALSALSRAAAASPIHLVLNDPAEMPELQDQWERIEESLEEQDVLFAQVQLELGLSACEGDQTLPESVDGFAGIFIQENLAECYTERLLMAVSLAQKMEKPATALLPDDDWRVYLNHALNLGFSRIIVPASSVSEVKDAIREL